MDERGPKGRHSVRGTWGRAGPWWRRLQLVWAVVQPRSLGTWAGAALSLVGGGSGAAAVWEDKRGQVGEWGAGQHSGILWQKEKSS